MRFAVGWIRKVQPVVRVSCIFRNLSGVQHRAYAVDGFNEAGRFRVSAALSEHFQLYGILRFFDKLEEKLLQFLFGDDALRQDLILSELDTFANMS